MIYQSYLNIALRAATAAGEILRTRSDDVMRQTAKRKESARDIVTEIDKLAEEKIIRIIRDTDADVPILAEEHFDKSWKLKKIDSLDRLWVVDALDGTVNYINHIPFYAVSIAYIERGKPAVGVVFNPALSELYYGARGVGVFRGSDPIKVRDAGPEHSLFACAFSGGKYDDKRSVEFDVFRTINDTSMGVLRTGSASVNLALLASGSLGGVWGRNNKIWDVAAGLLIAELAGAEVKINYSLEKPELVSYTASVPASSNFILEKTSVLMK